MPPALTNIGHNLKFLRRIRGLSQSELAKEIGLTRNNIASYESGMVEPNSTNFLKMAEYFHINPQDMLEKIMSENPTEVTPVIQNPQNELESYIQDHIEEFTKQTNTITKILEGYQEFYEMQKEDSMTIHEKELFSSIDNVLQLLDTLVKTNWKLIQTVFPTKNN